MSRQRDSRRGRLYAAECRAEVELYGSGIVEPLDGTLAAAQAFADRVLRSAWWRKHAYRTSAVELRSIRGSGGYYEPGLTRRISLGTDRRYHHDVRAATPAPIASPLMILHELCHHGTPPDAPHHGREFARLLLGAVRRFLGDEAWRILREEFVAGKVPHRKASSSSAARRGNPEALAAFRKESDGEWIVVATVLGPEREGWGSHVLGVDTWHGDERTVYVKSYSTANGVEKLTALRRRANIWRTRATAERWAERLAGAELPLRDVRVEPAAS